jgi:hypothetical protein
MFGGDTVVLSQILANAVQQLYQLYSIVRATQDTLNLMKSINEGVNDSLHLMQTVSGNDVAALAGEFASAQDAVQFLENHYGSVVNSKVSGVQLKLDQIVSQAFSQNRRNFDFARKIDQVGRSIDSQSHQVSPSGAQKLTAQGVGVMLQVMDETLRTQSSTLKLQAEQVALQNFKDKEEVKQKLDSSSRLKASLQQTRVHLDLPRF